MVDQTRVMIEDRFRRAPKGVLDMPTQQGAPVSTEGPPDDTENAYLNLYGSPDAPGFSGYPGGVAPGYRSYLPWGQGAYDPGLSYMASNSQQYPFPGGPSYASNYNWRRWNPEYARSRLGDYYLDAELGNVPRSQLNEYVQQQNRYIRNVNNRVRQINQDRMYSPRFLRHKAELKELRNFERRLANKVNRERENQPRLPDSPYL